MATTAVLNSSNEKVGDLELNDAVFAVEVNPHLLHDVVKMQLANRRSGNACTKTRGEVQGTSKKPWKQKGTGRARSGNRRSPLWRGGGTVFGPKPRDYSYLLPKKVRKLGLRMALSARLAEENLTVLDDFQLDEIKSKKFLNVMDALQIKNALIITSEHDDTLSRSSRNVLGYKVMPTEGLNVYDVLNYQHLILLKSSVEDIEKRLLA